MFSRIRLGVCALLLKKKKSRMEVIRVSMSVFIFLVIDLRVVCITNGLIVNSLSKEKYIDGGAHEHEGRGSIKEGNNRKSKFLNLYVNKHT